MKKLYLGIIVAVIIIFGFWFAINNNWPVVTEVKETQTVELKNGDMYDMVALYINQTIDGKSQRMLAYNGSIPGPTIKVKQGSEITINLKNNTDLPQLLHSHGVRMHYEFDGSQTVQREIQPGETFAYKLKFPDAGIYWYHPHAGESFAQPLGLFGAFLVEPTDPNYFPPADKDDVIFFSTLPIVGGKIDLKYGDRSNDLMGSYGNKQLLNGLEDYRLTANSGDVIRLYVVNAASARPLNFAIRDHQLKLVGGDNGAYEKPALVDQVLLGPSERAIVDVYLEKAGSFEILNKTPQISYAIGKLEVLESKSDRSRSFVAEWSKLGINTTVVKDINSYRKYFSAKPDKNILLTMSMGNRGMGGMHRMPDGSMMSNSQMMMAPARDGIEWEDDGMNRMMGGMIEWKIIDQDTGKVNMDIMWDLARDIPIKVRIKNDNNSMHPMQHPIHFHGQRFLVLSRDGKKLDNLVWKDTALIRAGEEVDILLDTSNPGLWMAHCHISEHLENGMMFEYKVD